jgi:hypothetical protein
MFMAFLNISGLTPHDFKKLTDFWQVLRASLCAALHAFTVEGVVWLHHLY